MAAKKKNAETVEAAAPSVIAVDTRKLSQGLKMTFEGMAMVFDSLGVDVGVPAVKTYVERTKCPVYWVKEPYLSNAVVDAMMSLDAEGLDETNRKNVEWVQEQLRRWPSVEFGYLKRLVDHITFDDWDTLKVVWVWGEESKVPYTVDRVSDYPDQTITDVDGHQRIGPFHVSGHRLDNVIKAGEAIREVILNTRIIPDNSQRFSCPPFIVRWE